MNEKAYTFAFDTRILQNATCVCGVFDGLHTGHCMLLHAAKKTAQASNTRFVILTFERDPDEVFHPQSIKKLMSNERRVHALTSQWSEHVVLLPTTQEFLSLSSKNFLDALFLPYTPASLHVGSNFHFGSHAHGNVHALATWGNAHNMHVCGHELFTCDGEVVSASRIRDLLAVCDIKRANKLLGRTWSLQGEVIAGRGQGRNLGFCTANIAVPLQLFVLGEGVYSAWATTQANKRYKAAVSVGRSPSFAQANANIEAHLIDFNENLYGQTLTLEFVDYLRPLIAFQSTEALISVVQQNIQWCKDNLH